MFWQTGHQAFFTHEALENIADTTIGNIEAFRQTGQPNHTVSADQHLAKWRSACGAPLRLVEWSLILGNWRSVSKLRPVLFLGSGRNASGCGHLTHHAARR